MQVTTPSAQSGLGSELVDWYRKATSVPYGHLLIDLSPRTDNGLRYSTNTGSIPSTFYIPDRLKQSEFLDDEHKNSLSSPSVPIILREMQKPFTSACGKEFIRFLSECIVNLLEGNRRSRKRHHLTEFQNESRLISVKRITWKQRRDNLASEKVLQLGKVHTLSVINHLSWHGAVCSRSWFCIQQEFECPVSYKVGTSKVSTFMKSHVPNWFAWEGSN